jgi:LysR family transcriptional activator of glutamate synthase operon
MELRHLRYLVALADAEHFTRAARTLGIAQPALSQQVRRLEAEVGLQLVERTTRRVSLTHAGKVLVTGARGVLRDVDRLTAELAALRGVQAGRLVVGVTRTPGAVDVAGALATFHGAYPGVELDVREGLSQDLLRDVRAGELDIAIIAEGPSLEAASFSVERVAVEPLVAIVPPDHPLSAKRFLSSAELVAQRVVTFHRGATIREQLEREASRLGVPLRVAFETADVQRTRQIVGHGLAVGVLPETDARAAGAEVVVIPVRNASFVHRTAVATVGDRAPTPAARALREVLVGGGSAER